MKFNRQLKFIDFFVYRLPNGEADPKSKHGGCPVLSGVKVRFPRLVFINKRFSPHNSNM
jgi:hypothetical protein